MSDRPLAPSALLERSDDRVLAVLDAVGGERMAIADTRWLVVLEAFVHVSTPGDAIARAVAAVSSPATASGADGARLQRARQQAAAGAILVSSRGIRVLGPGLPSTRGMITVTRASEGRGDVLALLLDRAMPETLTPSEAETATEELLRAGLLVPAVGSLDWGDLRRTTTLCPAFGLGRGTPVDRYYLDRFIEGHARDVTGDVLAVGGDPTDRLSFGLRHTSSFVIMDRTPGESVHLVADAHDPGAAPDGAFDCILLLNVLEHCADPRRVLANARGWLRPGGQALVMVPNAQRLHAAPDDLWRFSPSGLAHLFDDAWSRVEVVAYGNLTTVLASHLGIAAEELTDDELDLVQADHPVATCAVATA